MRSKLLIVVGLFSLGLIPLVVWGWGRAREIDGGSVSEDWVAKNSCVPPDPYVQ